MGCQTRQRYTCRDAWLLGTPSPSRARCSACRPHPGKRASPSVSTRPNARHQDTHIRSRRKKIKKTCSMKLYTVRCPVVDSIVQTTEISASGIASISPVAGDISGSMHCQRLDITLQYKMYATV
eukprot:3390050-Rhodomonas_salina.1